MKVIKLRESDIQRIVKRVLNEDISIECKDCVHKVLGDKYKDKIEKVFHKFEIAGGRPTVQEIHDEIIRNVKPEDEHNIIPRLMSCRNKCGSGGDKIKPWQTKGWSPDDIN